MIAIKNKANHKEIGKDEAMSAADFVERVRQKMPSRNHKFKKTDRVHLQSRYPEYREETEEEKQKKSGAVNASLTNLVKKGYDEELLAKLRRFLEFIKRIFKHKESETSPAGIAKDKSTQGETAPGETSQSQS